MKAFLIKIYHKLPRPLQHIISKIVYKPQFGKKVTLYGWPVFSKGVSIDDYSFMRQNVFMRNVSIGKFCSIAEGLSIGLNEHPFHEFSSYRMNGMPSPLHGRRGTGGGGMTP